ncbi:MAG TPA: TetR/AcrR family transcriptional regulator [Amycolatopsis sp.]|nr:TetR/AcrR family transcriptional regulator [Amycolatopsis sp.]
MAKADAGTARKRRQRGSINTDDIVAGAFEVARNVTLDQLSMPILADHLGVGVTSIYWYFRKKDDLLNAMTDKAVDRYARMASEIRESDTWQDTWQHLLRAHFTAQRDLHRADAVLSDLLLIRTSTYSREATGRMMAVIESLVAKLVADGFTRDNAVLVYNAISVYTRGAIIHDRVLRLANAATIDVDRQQRLIDWSAMPVLAGLVDHRPLMGTTDEDFDFGIDRLLCGFETLLQEQDT